MSEEYTQEIRDRQLNEWNTKLTECNNLLEEMHQDLLNLDKTLESQYVRRHLILLATAVINMRDVLGEIQEKI